MNTSTGHPVTCCGWHRGGVDKYLYPYWISAVDEGKVSMPCLGHFTPGKETLLIMEKTGWAKGPVWMGVVKRKSPAPTGVCTWDCPLHRKSLYHIHQPSPLIPVQAPGPQLSNNCAIINKFLKCRTSLTYEWPSLIFLSTDISNWSTEQVKLQTFKRSSFLLFNDTSDTQVPWRHLCFPPVITEAAVQS